MERKKIHDSVLIGEWEEVKSLPLSTFTNNEGDTERLDGIVIKGYETKFGGTNENGERYDPNCFDDFIDRYFIRKKMNMVVDVEHCGGNPDWRVGRVIYMESNSVGFYFVAYLPRALKKFADVKAMLKEGILQGFSKEGFAEEWENHYKADGTFDYTLIKKMSILSVSLVAMPANGQPFDSVGEVKNALTYENRNKPKADAPEADDINGLKTMFNLI